MRIPSPLAISVCFALGCGSTLSGPSNDLADGEVRGDGHSPPECSSFDDCGPDETCAAGACFACDAFDAVIGPRDGCCPDGADADTDADCTARCGNGVLETAGGELCDTAIASGLPGACPTECVAVHPCRPETLAGSGCQVRCEILATLPHCDCRPEGADDYVCTCMPGYVGDTCNICDTANNFIPTISDDECLFAGPFHVAPNGSDSWSGRFAAPTADGDGPLASLVGARDLIRALRREVSPSALVGPVRVIITDGVYSVASVVEFGPEDAATADSITSFEAAPGADPVFSGALPIGGWSAVKTTIHGVIWETTIPEVASGAWWFRDLYMNNFRLTRARFPNAGYLQISAVNNGLGDGFPFCAPSNILEALPASDQIVLSSTPPGGDLHASDAEIVAHLRWAIAREVITSSAGATLNFGSRVGTPYCFLRPWVNDRVFLEHAAAFVDRPHEWHLERDTGRLLLMLKHGVDPNSATIEAPRSETLLRLDGAAHISFSELSFAFSAFALPATGYSGQQGARYSEIPGQYFFLPAAIELERSSNITFDSVRVAHTGASAIGIGPDSHDNEVVGCELFDLGAGGVAIGWQREMVTGGGACCDLGVATPSDNTVHHSSIHHYGRTYEGACGLWLGYTKDSTLSHNEVRWGGYTGISAGWGWTDQATSQRGTVIEANVVENVLTTLTDGGGIYAMSLAPESRVAGNAISKIRKERYKRDSNNYFKCSGLYLEEMMSSWSVRDNVVWDVPTFGCNANTVTVNTYGINYFDRDQFYDANNAKACGDLAASAATFSTAAPPAAVTNILSAAGIGAAYADIKSPNRLHNASMPLGPTGMRPYFEDFEALPLWGKVPQATNVVEASGGTIVVSSEDAKSGSQSLKIADAAGQDHVHNPHFYFIPAHTGATTRVAFDLKIERDTYLVHQWRDGTHSGFKTGPTLTVSAGHVHVDGLPSMALPAGQWIHFEVSAGLGPDANGRWSLKVDGPSGNLVDATALSVVTPDWQELFWLGFASFATTGTQTQVFLDNLEIVNSAFGQ